jgi:hypothetical protein
MSEKPPDKTFGDPDEFEQKQAEPDEPLISWADVGDEPSSVIRGKDGRGRGFWVPLRFGPRRTAK